MKEILPAFSSLPPFPTNLYKILYSFWYILYTVPNVMLVACDCRMYTRSGSDCCKGGIVLCQALSVTKKAALVPPVVEEASVYPSSFMLKLLLLHLCGQRHSAAGPALQRCPCGKVQPRLLCCVGAPGRECSSPAGISVSWC